MVVKAMYNNNIVCPQLLRHSFIKMENLIVHVFVTLLETTLINIIRFSEYDQFKKTDINNRWQKKQI